MPPPPSPQPKIPTMLSHRTMSPGPDIPHTLFIFICNTVPRKPLQHHSPSFQGCLAWAIKPTRLFCYPVFLHRPSDTSRPSSESLDPNSPLSPSAMAIGSLAVELGSARSACLKLEGSGEAPASEGWQRLEEPQTWQLPRYATSTIGMQAQYLPVRKGAWGVRVEQATVTECR
jgi:hypothetical protein